MSLSKKFISDEEIEQIWYDCGTANLPKDNIGVKRFAKACIDKALEKAGVTEDPVPGPARCWADGSLYHHAGQSCGEPKHRPVVIYIQPAKLQKSAEDRIEAALRQVPHGSGIDRNDPCCPCVAKIAAKLRGE